MTEQVNIPAGKATLSSGSILGVPEVFRCLRCTKPRPGHHTIDRLEGRDSEEKVQDDLPCKDERGSS